MLELLITFDDTNADDRYSGKTFTLFPCRWDAETNKWVRCPFEQGEQFGMYSRFNGEVDPFLAPARPPEAFGTITTTWREDDSELLDRPSWRKT